MLSDATQAGLNDQITLELASAYTYLAMSAWFEANNLPGSAAWMRRQAKEEVAHAMRVFDYVTDRDGRVTLQAVAQPPVDFAGVQEVWERALAHEQKVTASIHRLYASAQKEGDYATQAMLQWFVSEQVEEEKTARTILEQVKLIKPTSSSLFFLDRHLGKDAEEGGAGT